MKTGANQQSDCALYIRVSTADQGERYSLPSQLKALREKAEREGYRVREDWIFVDKHTGKVASRPDFDRMNALVKSGAVGAVFIFSVDRFARRTEDALRLAREYKQYGAKLDFVESFYEDTPVGRFTFTQLAAFSELWGEKILADSARGRKQKLESGKLEHGSAPFGYVYIDKRQKDGARLEIDTAMSSVEGITKRQVIEDVFRWRVGGISGHEIARKLNEAGIRSAGHNGKPGGLWSGTTVRQLLRNPTYCGRHTRSGIVVPCPAIIDVETWTAAQRMRDEARKRHVGRPSNKYLLRGFVFCSKCGRRCITNPNHGYPHYRCGSIEYKPFRRLCDASGVSSAKIEDAAWQTVWSILMEPKRLLKLCEAYIAETAKPESSNIAKLEAEATRMRKRIETTGSMMQDSLIDYAKGKADIRACNERVRQIEAELTAAGRVISLPLLKQVEAAARQITEGPEPTTYEGRRSILEGIIELRMSYYDGDLDIDGKIPVPAESAVGGKKNWDRSVRPDPERQRQHRDRGEDRTAAQQAQGEANIVEHARSTACGVPPPTPVFSAGAARASVR